MTQLADSSGEGNLYLGWTSSERRARGPLVITTFGLDESPTPCVFRSYRATAEGRAVGSETVRRVSALTCDLFAALDTRILADRHFRIDIYSRLCEDSRDTIFHYALSQACNTTVVWRSTPTSVKVLFRIPNGCAIPPKRVL